MSDMMKELEQFLGFNPSRKDDPTQEVLSTALNKIREERKKAAELEAESLMREAIKTHEEFTALEKQFEAQRSKHYKRLGELLKQLRAGVAKASQPSGQSTETTDNTP